MNIAFLGGGNMAGALIGGLIARGFDAGAIHVVEVNAEARARLAAHYAVHVAAARRCRVARLRHAGARGEAAGHARGARVARHGPRRRCSSSALPRGLRLETLSRWMGGHRRIVRCMPNTPALIGKGISGLYAPPDVSGDERARAEAGTGRGGRGGLGRCRSAARPGDRGLRQRAGLRLLVHRAAGGGGREARAGQRRARSDLALATVRGAAELAARRGGAAGGAARAGDLQGRHHRRRRSRSSRSERMAERLARARRGRAAAAAPSWAT